MLEKLNTTLFLLINAPAHANGVGVGLAIFCADYLVFSIPLLLVAGWLYGSATVRRHALEAFVAGLIGLALNQLIGLFWQHPRPFMIGLGHTLIPHAADSSFPSDHMTLMCAVGLSLWLHVRTRLAGLALLLLALPVAWARIYLGVHFPLDMLGAIAVAGVSACLSRWSAPRYLDKLHRPIDQLYRLVFAGAIRAGWVKP
ncbi:undecaprenyl-diphosphatase [Leeia oryzae]|uniref:undecaprenyl-diphosphatase n=1 Tax=Leeia oryzae TaxID=356662 RepID=UPI00036AF0FD|nr:undecaprenyl-diphosphatase [Leeia oryzae]